MNFPSFASIDKDTRGSAGRKCPHTASKPLRIRKVFSAAFSLRQNCFASDSLGFSRDFCSFGRRRAVARQGEKGKKLRKDWLSDVWALVNRRFVFWRQYKRKSRSVPSDRLTLARQIQHSCHICYSTVIFFSSNAIRTVVPSPGRDSAEIVWPRFRQIRRQR